MAIAPIEGHRSAAGKEKPRRHKSANLRFAGGTAALEKLRPIDFVDVIPGHGETFKGKDRIDWFQAYLRDSGSRPSGFMPKASPRPTPRAAST
jgi:hypothetical protein